MHAHLLPKMSRLEPFRFVAADLYRSEGAYMRKYHRYGPYHRDRHVQFVFYKFRGFLDFNT